MSGMKRMKIADKISISMLSLIILVYSTMLQFSVPSVVLCFGNDGHIAFEQAEDWYPCMDLNKQGDNLIGNHESLSHQEEDCNDIPLINLFSIPFIEKECKSKNFEISIVDNYYKMTYSNFISHLNLLKESIAIHPTVENLQTTILLI